MGFSVSRSRSGKFFCFVRVFSPNGPISIRYGVHERHVTTQSTSNARTCPTNRGNVLTPVSRDSGIRLSSKCRRVGSLDRVTLRSSSVMCRGGSDGPQKFRVRRRGPMEFLGIILLSLETLTLSVSRDNFYQEKSSPKFLWTILRVVVLLPKPKFVFWTLTPFLSQESDSTLW